MDHQELYEGGELITIDLVPVKPPDEEEEKKTSDPKGPTDLISTGPTPVVPEELLPTWRW